jgi:hypothetical protein
MRNLEQNELYFVSGAGCCPPPPCCECDTRQKNNNGYGNGAEAGPAPGHSGEHNPQLLTQNSGKKGPR